MTPDKTALIVLTVIIYIQVAIILYCNYKWRKERERADRLNRQVSDLWLELGMYRRIDQTQNRWKPNSRKDITHDKN